MSFELTPEKAQEFYNAGEISYADLAFINATHAFRSGDSKELPRRMLLSDVPISLVAPTPENTGPNPFIPKNQQTGNPPWQPYWIEKEGLFAVRFPWGCEEVEERLPGEGWPDESGKLIPEPTTEEIVAVKNPEMAGIAQAHQIMTPENFLDYCGQLGSQLSSLVLEARQIITVLKEIKTEARRVSRLRAKRQRKEAAQQIFLAVQARERSEQGELELS